MNAIKMYTQKLVATFCILSFISIYVECESEVLNPEKLGKEFRELDNLLSQQIDSTDVAENIKIVENLIPEAESSTFMGIKNKKSLAKAERLFLSLTKLEDEKMCNRDGLKISIDNAKAIKKAGSLKRLGRIYKHYVVQQQNVCFKVFPAILEKKLAEMDQAKLARLDYVMTLSTNKDLKARIDANGLFYLIKIGMVGPNMEKLNETLKNLPQDATYDPELKGNLKGDDLQKLVVARYLTEPCDHFIVNLAEDMFVLASTWIQFHKPDVDQYNFYYNWARYKFCANVLRGIEG